MNKTLIVAAVSALASVGALAQTSVTLYGRVNTTAEYQKNIGANGVGNDGKQKVLQNNASRLGFKGAEDLGGGLKAEFLLEHRFNSDTGTVTGDFYSGDAWVGLTGAFGAVRMGRLTSAAYYATADYISLHNHDTGTSEDKLYTYLSQNKNTIAYTTPSLGGLTGEVSISAAEGPVITNKVGGLALNYNTGPFQFGAGFEVVAGTRDKQLAIRANTELGPVTLGVYVQRSELRTLGDRNAIRLSGMYTIAASEFHLNFGMADDWSRLNNSDAKQFTVGYNYNLSKRTKVYGFATKVDNSSAFSYFGATGVGGRVLDPSSVALGVRHNF